jgi:sulfur relay (sulfurtransferase) DsrF/TusC family protein
MSRYLISSPHTSEECVRSLDAMLAKGSNVLDKFVFGCDDGDHTGYAIVDVKSLSDALALVPDFLQENACITKVEKLSAADIRAMHKKAA